MVINTILFDVGGVIFTPIDETAVDNRRGILAQNLGFANAEQMWLHFFSGQEWDLAKTGQWTDAEMWAALLEPFGLTDRDQQVAFLDQLYDGVGLKSEMKRLIIKLHHRYKLGILSNASDILDQLLFAKMGIGDYFSVIVNSHFIGVAKPERVAYEIALSRLEAEPEQIFFVDDQLRNTVAAEALGIRSHVFKGVGTLREELDRISIT